MTSENPRLSRKELRELGKLSARPVNAPSLTDTQELRLRRPSRKELREAEQKEKLQNLELARKAEQEEEKSESISESVTELNNSENTQLPQRTSVFDRFTQVTDESDISLARVTADSEADADDDAPSLRDQLFARMQKDAVSAADNQVVSDGAKEKAPAKEETSEKETTSAVESSYTKDVLVAEQSDSEPEKQIIEDQVQDQEVEVETEEVPKRTWFIFLISVIIVAIAGYLFGSWIYSTFFAAGSAVTPEQLINTLLI